MSFPLTGLFNPGFPRIMGSFLFLMILFTSLATAGEVTQHYNFSSPLIVQDGEYSQITMKGAKPYGAPGEPVLPMQGAQLLLPPGEAIVSIQVIPGEMIDLGNGHRLYPGQLQTPIGSNQEFSFQEPNLDIYASTSSFPGRLHDEPQANFFRGYQVASFALHPVSYIPISGNLQYMKNCDVVITTEPDYMVLDTTEKMIRHDKSTITRLGNIIQNKSEIDNYRQIDRVRSMNRDLDQSAAYKYIIITTESWYDQFTVLADFNTRRGLSTGIFLNSWIQANYTGGVDEQDNIRNFVIDAYTTWDIDYLLLAGDARDANGIPHRGLYSTTAYGESDSDIPADMYYGCLDGNWNSDGDSRWGEPAEADMYHEVAVGRACVSDLTDASNFVTKVMRYQAEPVVDECAEALMVGELLWSDPTWGGDYKDEIKDGASTHDYTTIGFPPSMNVGTLYDRNSTWSGATLISMLESGVNIVNHLGHCDTEYAMKLYLPDIPSFDNDGINHTYNFIYSQGCYCGAFDNRTSGGSYVSDCFAEQFQTDVHGGVAMLMNSRYGWGEHSSTNGSSQYFDREFFDAMFGEAIFPIGEANDDSRMDTMWAINYGANRWCYYELNVFGDPAMHLWTAEPTAMLVEHPAAVQLGDQDIVITVSAGTGQPLADARVAIYTSDYSLYETGITDFMGHITLHSNATEPGALHVVATAHNRFDYSGEITLVPPDGPYLIVSAIEYLDVPDGMPIPRTDMLHSGTYMLMRVKLSNVGSEIATGISASISTTADCISLSQTVSAYPDVMPAVEVWSELFYEFGIDGDAPDGLSATLDLAITADDNCNWDSDINFIITAPVITISDILVDDTASGNGDYRLDPGETAALTLTLLNAGSAQLESIEGHLTCSHPHLQISSSVGSHTGLSQDESGILAPPFTITVDPAFVHYDVDLCLEVIGSHSYAGDFEFTLPVGGFYEPIEGIVSDWDHLAVSSGFSDQWHLSTSRNHTQFGSQSWKCGAQTSTDYDGLLDAGLETPPAVVAGEGELRFWMWVEAEESSYYEGKAYDGGLIEMSVDGGEFIQMTPEGGYSHTIREGGTPGPFAADTPVFSGNIDWTEIVVDLADIEGEVVFRFRFGSDGAGGGEGWYIDDVEISGLGSLADAQDQSLTQTRLHLSPSQPNPFSAASRLSFALPVAGEASVKVYDLSGRLVKTLISGDISAGSHNVAWDGTDDLLRPVASGLYFYRLSTGTDSRIRSVVLMR
jgi:Peptidase family C25/FlgD Ig-like domain/Propeptide_C25